MRSHVGEHFEGTVNAVTSFGLFVELAGIHVEGLVHITSLPNDYYQCLGDAVRVKVMRVDLDERKIDLEIQAETGKRKGRKKRS